MRQLTTALKHSRVVASSGALALVSSQNHTCVSPVGKRVPDELKCKQRSEDIVHVVKHRLNAWRQILADLGLRSVEHEVGKDEESEGELNNVRHVESTGNELAPLKNELVSSWQRHPLFSKGAGADQRHGHQLGRDSGDGWKEGGEGKRVREKLHFVTVIEVEVTAVGHGPNL